MSAKSHFKVSWIVDAGISRTSAGYATPSIHFRTSSSSYLQLHVSTVFEVHAE